MSNGMEMDAPRTKRARPRTEARRAQGRRHQARYREKQKAVAVALERAVPRLRHLVERLERHCFALHNVVAMRRDAPRLVLSCIDCFHRGVDGTSPAIEGRIAFLKSVFHDNVRVGDSHGFDHLLMRNLSFMRLFDDVKIEAVGAESLGSDDCVVVRAAVRVEMTVSLMTIRHVFPQLLRDEFAAIKWRLLGVRLVCLGSATHVFDECGRVSEVDWIIDYVAALQSVLTLEEIAIVLSQACITRGVYFMNP